MRRVCFIKPIGMDGPVKIGTSISPDKRRETLATWCPFPLEIVAELDGGIDLERRFHAMFEGSFIGREWFAITPELQQTIGAIRNGTFDMATLPPPLSMMRFRKKKDMSFCTPAWRYKRSFESRYRHVRRDYRVKDAALRKVLGTDEYRAHHDLYLAKQDELEALIERMRSGLAA